MVWPRGWAWCAACSEYVPRVFLSPESKACAWPGRRIGWLKHLRVPTSDKDEGEEPREPREQREREEEEEEKQGPGGDTGAKIHRSKIFRFIR